MVISMKGNRRGGLVLFGLPISQKSAAAPYRQGHFARLLSAYDTNSLMLSTSAQSPYAGRPASVNEMSHLVPPFELESGQQGPREARSRNAQAQQGGRDDDGRVPRRTGVLMSF